MQDCSLPLLKMNYFTVSYFTLWMIAFKSPYFIPNNSKYSTASTSWQHEHSTFLSIAPHLPYLYHSVTLWFFVDFSCLLGILVPHQSRIRLQLNSEAYSEHSRTSKTSFIWKQFTGFSLKTIFTKNSILDAWLGSWYVS